MLMSPISGWSGASVLDGGVLITKWAGLVVPAASGGWAGLWYTPPAAAVRGGLALRRIRGLVGRPGACEERAVKGRPGCAVIAPADSGGGTDAQTRTTTRATAKRTPSA